MLRRQFRKWKGFKFGDCELIDGHAHLNEIKDIDAAISRAVSAGFA